ncbi:MAG: hypothetical protein ACRDF5_00020 [bacterium]
MTARLLAAALLGASLLAAPAAPGASQTPDDRLIVPGQRIGKWALNASIQDLTRTAGPSGVQEAADANRPPLVIYSWAPPGIAALSRDRSKVEFLYLYGGTDYKTDKAIGRGSTADAARRAYNKPVLTTLGSSQRAMLWDGLGLAFVVTPARVSAVLVFRPGTAEDVRLPALLPAPAPSPEPRP